MIGRRSGGMTWARNLAAEDETRGQGRARMRMGMRMKDAKHTGTNVDR